MIVTYEITAKVRPDLCDTYEQYMRSEHIPDLLTTGAFVAASISKTEEGIYQVRYEARDRSALDIYLRDYAPRLRDDFAKHFPEGVEINRAEWTVIQSWTN